MVCLKNTINQLKVKHKFYRQLPSDTIPIYECVKMPKKSRKEHGNKFDPCVEVKGKNGEMFLSIRPQQCGCFKKENAFLLIVCLEYSTNSLFQLSLTPCLVSLILLLVPTEMQVVTEEVPVTTEVQEGVPVTTEGMPTEVPVATEEVPVTIEGLPTERVPTEVSATTDLVPTEAGYQLQLRWYPLKSKWYIFCCN